VPPARCFVDDTVVYRANLIHGVQSGMSYTWQSTMEQHGLADVNFNDSLIYVVYHAAGSDTVSLVATNAYGSDTAMAWRQVKDCPAVTVPWYEDFEVVNPCWSGSWTPDYITYTWLDSTTHVMRSTPNSWYVSPWIDLPDTTGLQLMWNKNGNANSFMKIFVSPTGSIEPADFTDTLLYRETPNGFDSLPLDAYAGRRIRVAFAQLASSNYSDSYVLDDVRVDYNRAAPQVSLTAPLFAISFGDAITATATLGNIAPGVTYSWSSTFGVVTAMGAQCRISYTVAGEDTITVVASNPYGRDTALAVVTVYDCGSMTTVPFFEDFSNITTTTYRVRGWLPPCWNATWNGDTLGLAPHVITTGGYQWIGDIPDNALLMQAGTSTGYGSLAEVVLPRFADSLHRLMMAFDYRFEINTGTLVVGYYDDTVFTAVDTLARHTGNYRRDTVSFAMHSIANNPHIAIRWQSNNGSFFAVVIDNIEVFVDSTLIPLTPDTVWRTVTVHMLLDNGDTLFEADVVSVTGAGSYPDSTLVTLTAYYDNYYPYFWYWVTPANDTLYDNPYSFVVTSDTVINAIFGPMCVGIDGTEGAAPDVAIHPNPATGDAYVSVGVPSTVTVVDLQGRTVLQPTRVASTLCIQQGTLPNGIYFVSVSNSVGTVVKKLVIQ
jgi:hypothetical protein